ncbi:MAG: DUF3348 domain-containing protein [Luteibacter jiangsuensis]
MQALQRTTVRGPTFIRLLARLTAVEAGGSGPSLPDRLSRWLDWTHAIALSTALDGRTPPAPDDVPPFDSGEDAECARARATLVKAIEGARELAPRAASRSGTADADFAPFRQRYLTLQRSMQGTTGQLRGRLRDMLAQVSPSMARLAKVDAVMEMALSPREQKLLATVPAVLGDHFDRLRRAGEAEAASLEEGTVPSQVSWLDKFRGDMRSVLLAELDVRFQPVEALLAALRTR